MGHRSETLGAVNALSVDASLNPDLSRRGVKLTAERPIEMGKIGKAGVARDRSDGATGEAQVGQKSARKPRHMFPKTSCLHA